MITLTFKLENECENCSANEIQFKQIILPKHFFIKVQKRRLYRWQNNSQLFSSVFEYQDIFINYTVDDMSICESCYENSNYCEHTDESTFEEVYTVYSDSSSNLQVRESALSEFYECPDCADYNTECNMRYVVDDERDVCSNCADNYSSCNECGALNNDMTECSDCGHCDDSDDACDYIRNYNYRPNFNFIGNDSKNNPFLGFEVEIESKDDKEQLAEYCYNNFKDCYLKHDGSLNDGFEVVSMPKTLKEHYASNYEDHFKGVINLGGRSHNTETCGIHVHIDKKHMTESHKVRFGMFFSLCKPQLTTIARRDSSKWSKYKPTGLAWSEYKNSERYEAVNWTNDSTVEVRIFKGTLKYSTFISCLELSHAIYNFTLEKHCYSVRLESHLVFKRLINFIQKQNRIDGSYQYLLDYLASKDFNTRIEVEEDEIDMPF